AEVDPHTQEKHTRDKILWRSDDDDLRRNQINAIAARKQNKPHIILVEKNLAGASSTKKRKRDDNQQISPIENSADLSIPNAFLSPIMSSCLVTLKNPQPDTTLDNM
ncbi:8095_t:CDS:1, partial [Rhizophagus irregularis]